MSIVSQGRFLGKPSSFKYRKSDGIGSGINLSAKRKDSLEKRAIGDKQDKEAARTKEVSRREKESKQRQRQMVKGVSEETDTEKRQKVVAVSRPETAKTPLDARSKLYKQTEIKNKIIDENEVKSMTFQKYHNLPDSLVSAVTAVLERVKNPFIDDDKKMKSKKDDDQDDDDTADMKSKKTDDLDDEDENDSDKMIGTSGKKTKVELKPKTQSANEETGGLQSLGRSTSSYDAKHKPEDKRRSELYKHPDGHIEVHNFNNHYGYGKPISITKHNDYASATRAATDHLRTAGAKTMKEELNGKQHKLDKNKNGRLDKHDFKLLRKEETELDEVGLSDEEMQRILTKLKESDDKAYKYRDTDPADKDNDYDATKDKNPEHIVMQLRKAKSLGAANRPIHFHDGSKVKVSSAHVQKALDMHGSFKRAPAKDEFTQKLQASHSSFKKALGE